MSKQTGATDFDIEVAASRIMAQSVESISAENKRDRRDRYVRQLRYYAKFLVPPGYRIVPADAVVIDRATADTAAEACERVGNACIQASGCTFSEDIAIDWRNQSARYRAAAAALRGETKA